MVLIQEIVENKEVANSVVYRKKEKWLKKQEMVTKVRSDEVVLITEEF